MTINTKPRPRSKRICSPNCEFFKCSKKAIGHKTNVGGRPRLTCNFVEGDLCSGFRCTYSFCAKHKLKTDGTCGLEESAQPKEDDETIEQKFEAELTKKEQQDTKYQLYLKNKYKKKLSFKDKKY